MISTSCFKPEKILLRAGRCYVERASRLGSHNQTKKLKIHLMIA